MSHVFVGARGHVVDPADTLSRIRAWGEASGVEVLVADARVVFGTDHLESALRHAERAGSNGAMTARSLAMEALLYLSAKRQVTDAIRVAGIRQGTQAVALAILGEALPDGLLRELGWSRDDAVLEPEGKDPGALGISEAEKGTVPRDRWADLVLERVALLDVFK